MTYEVRQITYQDTKPFILDIHYAKRMPSISYAYGLFLNGELEGVVSYGSPISPQLCSGIAGQEYEREVIELNRLVLKNNRKNEASFLVGKSLRLLEKPKIVVSYADTEQDHIGYIYQATNFLYTGLSAKRTEWRIRGQNKHSKTIIEQHSLEERKTNPDKFYVIDRPRKHRYILFLGSKTQKKNYLRNLKYKIQPYPKSGR